MEKKRQVYVIQFESTGINGGLNDFEVFWSEADADKYMERMKRFNTPMWSDTVKLVRHWKEEGSDDTFVAWVKDY